MYALRMTIHNRELNMFKMICASILLFFLLVNENFAQTSVRFGFRGGYSMSTQYGIDPVELEYTVTSYFRHALAGGFLIEYRLTDTFGIQQEFLYVMKGSREDIGVIEQDVTTYTSYNLNYFEIPIVFRYTFLELGEVKLFGAVGYALSILLNGESRLDGSVEQDGDQIPFTYSTELEGVDIFDYSFIYGSGVEFPLFGKDCFFEYRFTIGWNTLMMPTYPSEDPAPLRNQSYNFTLGVYL